MRSGGGVGEGPPAIRQVPSEARQRGPLRWTGEDLLQKPTRIDRLQGLLVH